MTKLYIFIIVNAIQCNIKDVASTNEFIKYILHYREICLQLVLPKLPVYLLHNVQEGVSL